MATVELRVVIAGAVVIAMTAAGACRGRSQAGEASTVTSQPAPPHSHEHAPPHGGTLIELGEEFAHLEFVFDRPAGRVTVFVLDGEAEHPIRIADASLGIVVDAPAAIANRPLELTGVASVLTGERTGATSEFSLTRHDLTGIETLTGHVLSCQVRGQTFRDVVFRVTSTTH